jgi:pSer/pThr/pTyr-binding forkhead associated (FHA) protein
VFTAKQAGVCVLRRCGTDETIRITKDRVLIGSHRHCDVTIKSTTIAPVNCQLAYQGGSWLVRNLADISQTKVNGRDVLEATLSVGDILWIGTAHKYVVESPNSEPDHADARQLDDTQALAFIMLRAGQNWSEPIQLLPVHTFGRGEDNSTALPDDTRCSREHCKIVQNGERWVIQDLGSRNGTCVNGELTTVPRQLCNNDLISIGNSQFMFQDRASCGEETRSHHDTEVG